MATDPAANIANLEIALASGELEVMVNGERVTYRSIEELTKAINYFRGQMTRAPQTTYATFSR